MASRPRGAHQRPTFLSIDGRTARVHLTPSERSALLRRLQPFIDVARPAGEPAASPVETRPTELDASGEAAVRRARLAALLGTDCRAARDASADPALDALVSAAAELFERALADETRTTYRRRWPGWGVLPSS